MTAESSAIEQELAAACSAHFAEVGTVASLRRLAGGASQETYGFEFVSATGRRPLILRKDAGTEQAGVSKATELALMQAAHRHGVPSPQPHCFVTFAGGLTGFVMDWVPGEAIARKILRDPPFEAARARLTSDCGQALARIHAIPVSELPPLSGGGDASAARAVAEQVRLLDSFEDKHPVFELALRWLAASLPKPSSPRLVHGDFRLGNFMVNEQGLAAVLDWEIAHLGDPLEDLGWLCVKSWRFGAKLPVGGFGTREALFEAYERASGQAVDARAVRFWEVYGTLKWGLICKAQAALHSKGIRHSLELASLGRRAVETESDLLLLLE